MSDFCKIYAMDIERRASLLGLLELKTDDHKVAEVLHRVILDKQSDKIVDDFYDYLLQHNEYALLLEPDLIPALKQAQAAYVRSFGVDFDSSDYFDYRLRIGLAHKRVGLTLGLYQCAYRQLQQLMLNEIPENFMQDGVNGRDLCCFIHKITTLDMALAIETYHDALVMDIQDELDNVYFEKAALRERVQTDSLTGLFTRDYGLAILKKLLIRGEVENDICLILLDIDFFKLVNDTYGHLAGDEVLRQIGKLLNSAVRDFDTVCRFGGEEFMIVLRHTTKNVAMKVAERIRQSISENIVQFDGKDIQVTISQGVAVAQSESDSMVLLNKADAALYEAKAQGRNCVVMSGADVIRD
ncbi:MAG: diguanylate cyclase [Sulfuriflexus sp.]|nr:diguanylate cyclase [Sulfuriflexus sp.]